MRGFRPVPRSSPRTMDPLQVRRCVRRTSVKRPRPGPRVSRRGLLRRNNTTRAKQTPDHTSTLSEPRFTSCSAGTYRVERVIGAAELLPLGQLRPGLAENGGPVVERDMMVRAEDRFQSAAELREALADGARLR